MELSDGTERTNGQASELCITRAPLHSLVFFPFRPLLRPGTSVSVARFRPPPAAASFLRGSLRVPADRRLSPGAPVSVRPSVPCIGIISGCAKPRAPVPASALETGRRFDSSCRPILFFRRAREAKRNRAGTWPHPPPHGFNLLFFLTTGDRPILFVFVSAVLGVKVVRVS